MKYSLEPLTRDHKFVGFSCGLPKVDNWFRNWAIRDLEAKACKVFLLFGDGALLGFFSTSAKSIPLGTVPVDLLGKFRYKEVPAVLIGWMGRGVQFRGEKIGTLLLVEALKKACEIEAAGGVKFVVADAITEESVKFFIERSFTQLVDDGRHENKIPRLILPIETARQMVDAWETQAQGLGSSCLGAAENSEFNPAVLRQESPISHGSTT